MASWLKEVHRLMRKIGKMSSNQATITDIDWEGFHIFTITIQPNGGPYKAGIFNFEIALDDRFPQSNPWVWCTTEIYHPNIDNWEERCNIHFSNVCLNLFDRDTWCSSFGLEGIVLGLLFLMHHPNLEDVQSPYFDGGVDLDLFHDNVKKYMAGEEISEEWEFETGFKVIDGVLVETVCDNKDIEIEDNSTNEGTNTSENSEVFNCTNTDEKTDNENKTGSDTVDPVTNICKNPDTENETVVPFIDVSKIPVETDESIEKTNYTIKDEVIETETDVESAAVQDDDANDDDDDGNENTPLCLRIVEGDVVLVFGEIDDDVDIIRNTQILEKDSESMAVMDIASACGEMIL